MVKEDEARTSLVLREGRKSANSKLLIGFKGTSLTRCKQERVNPLMLFLLKFLGQQEPPVFIRDFVLPVDLGQG